MNIFEINKIVGAILLTALVVTASSLVGNRLVPEPAPAPEPARVEAAAKGDAQEAPAKAEEAAPAKPEQAAPAASPAALLAAASVEDGRKVARRCSACHTFGKGGKHRVGPNLWDVVGRAKASAEGYSFSAGLKGVGGAWSYGDLDRFLAKPKDMARGTKMSFRVKRAKDRANVIVFLRTLSDAPKPLPGE